MNKDSAVLDYEDDIVSSEQAFKLCNEMNGEVEIRTIDELNYRYCVFENGKECEEWDLLAGRCDNSISDFCGASTLGKCKSDYDCKEDGCSGEVCGSLSEEIATDCEFKDCHDNEYYELKCKCINSQCQWIK